LSDHPLKRKEYPEIAPNHFVVITNGYDPDDYEVVKPKQLPGFTIVYTGKFKTGENFRNPSILFQAMKKLDLRGIPIRFVHVGAIEQRIVDMAENVGISSQIEFAGWRPYHETLAFAKGADILLVIGGGQLTEQTGKIFDYIACNRPILALADHDSDIYRIVQALPNSILLEQPSDDTLAEAIIQIRNHGLKDDSERPRPQIYDRRVLAQKLSTIFDEVLNEIR
jgi:glycosyltransferase involved in cell wall biosynthesis